MWNALYMKALREYSEVRTLSFPAYKPSSSCNRPGRRLLKNKIYEPEAEKHVFNNQIE